MDPTQLPSVDQLLEQHKPETAEITLRKLYTDAIGGDRKAFISTLHEISLYYIRYQRFPDAHRLLLAYGVPSVEVAVNFVTVCIRLNRPDEEIFAARLRVYQQAMCSPVVCRPVLTDLFFQAARLHKWEIVVGCGKLLESSRPYDSKFWIVYTDAFIALKRLTEAKSAVSHLLHIVEFLDTKELASITYSRLAGIYKDTGEMRLAVEAQQKCVELSRDPAMQSNAIMMMQYSDVYGMSEFYKACYVLERMVEPISKFVHTLDTYDVEKADTGLRIGFVSGDFCTHSLTSLLLPIFQQFKDSEIAGKHTLHVFYTRNPTVEDISTLDYASCVSHFHQVGDLSFGELAEFIRCQSIDILIDLSGNTAHNRIPMFQYHPAPVQTGWVSGMMTPAGTDSITSFITDPGFVPAGAKVLEELYFMSSAYSYTPLANSPSIKPVLPVDTVGHITYGCFNNPCKINDTVLRIWSDILRRTLNSQLIYKVYDIAHGERIKLTLGKYGVASERVEFVATNFPRTEDLMSFYTSKIDIALDTWPCAGMLTTIEAMWMGVPVPSFIGPTFLHNQSVSVLRQTGLSDLVGNSAREYVDKVVELSRNRTYLKELRQDLRDRIKSAPLSDPKKLAKELILSLETLWRNSCKRKQSLLA